MKHGDAMQGSGGSTAEGGLVGAPLRSRIGPYTLRLPATPWLGGSRVRAEALRRGKALKLTVYLPPDGDAGRARWRDRWRALVTAAPQLHHEALEAVVEYIDTEGMLALVVLSPPWFSVEGLLLASPEPFAWGEVRRELRLVAEALEVLHAAGFVHTRLEPAHVFVDKDGPWWVGGLPLACRAESVSTSQRLPLGEPGFRSPEQLLGQENGVPSDVYAFGVLAYRLITGRYPWPDNAEAFALALIKQREIVVPSDALAGVPAAVASTILACMRVDPAARPASMAAVAEAFGSVPRRTSASEVGRATPLQAVATSGRVPVSWLVAAVLAVMAGAVAWVASVPSTPAGATAVPGRAAPAAGTAASSPSAASSAPAPVPPPEPSYPKTWRGGSAGTLHLVPAGTFMMGPTPGEGGRNEDEVRRKVTLTKPYYVAEHEVTVDEWRAVMNESTRFFPRCGSNCPVVGVLLDDVEVFLRRISERDGVRYRLLTEAEWERAARGGLDHAYSGADDPWAVSWFGAYSEGTASHEGPTRVCSRRRNAYGLCDMSGNVAELVADGVSVPSAADVTDPVVPPTPAPERQMAKGGNWAGGEGEVRVAYRYSFSDELEYNGFRVGMDASEALR
jgi:formylglycine-generating enzyme required for sulfatase activity